MVFFTIIEDYPNLKKQLMRTAPWLNKNRSLNFYGRSSYSFSINKAVEPVY